MDLIRFPNFLQVLKVRLLKEEDLLAIAGHIRLQPKLINEKWGGVKIYY